MANSWRNIRITFYFFMALWPEKKKQKFCLRSLITNSYRFREFLFKMENGDKS